MDGRRILSLLEGYPWTIGARIPGLRKLVQSHRMNVAEDRYAPNYDGMAELWFDDADALLAARSSPQWQASSQDEANFIDPDRKAYFISQEYLIAENIDSKR
jgi:uncharacterized protein (TIGR02118 family)